MSQDANLPDSLAEGGIRDTRLIARAIRQKWPIPDAMRQALIDRQIEIATSSEVSPREATSAFRAVLAANQQNIAAKKNRRPKPLLLSCENVIVPGDLEETKRRLDRRIFQYAQRVGLIDADAVYAPRHRIATDDA